MKTFTCLCLAIVLPFIAFYVYSAYEDRLMRIEISKSIKMPEVAYDDRGNIREGNVNTAWGYHALYIENLHVSSVDSLKPTPCGKD